MKIGVMIDGRGYAQVDGPLHPLLVQLFEHGMCAVSATSGPTSTSRLNRLSVASSNVVAASAVRTLPMPGSVRATAVALW